MILNLDHIAILTEDLESVAATLPTWLTPLELEKHPEEGTLEQYACPVSATDPCLLLLQAIQDGPYLAALRKRGAGLHHVACSTDSMEAAVRHFAGHGMLLHPITMETSRNQVAWMCRPGVPFLLELNQVSDITEFAQQRTQIELPASRVGPREPIHFIPNLEISVGEREDISLHLGADTLRLDPWSTRA